jgi:hypothetical protein
MVYIKINKGNNWYSYDGMTQKSLQKHFKSCKVSSFVNSGRSAIWFDCTPKKNKITMDIVKEAKELVNKKGGYLKS